MKYSFVWVVQALFFLWILSDLNDTEKLDFIAKQLQSWIDFSKQEHEDSHIIPPMWPTKCQLENWIKALSGNYD